MRAGGLQCTARPRIHAQHVALVPLELLVVVAHIHDVFDAHRKLSNGAAPHCSATGV